MVAPCGGDIIVAAHPEGKPRLKKIILLALISAIGLSTASAVEVTSLYTAQVTYDERKRDPRADAYDRALAQVLLRVSGAELVNDVVLFDTLFPDPSAYVVQFRPGPEETLFVSFDGKAIEDTLRRAGQRVWGGDRPLTLVWLAVDWGGAAARLLLLPMTMTAAVNHGQSIATVGSGSACSRSPTAADYLSHFH